MKERPIIFTGESVRAILEGRKTQTRRVIKWDIRLLATYRDRVEAHYIKNGVAHFCNDFLSHCPYGQVGDRLWVRETYWQDQSGGVWCYKAGGLGRGLEGSLEPEFPPRNCGGKLVSTLFMPRWASRIDLEITGLRAERLQEIIAGDCTKEGIVYEDGDYVTMKVFDKFRLLWDSLNAKRGYGWDTNSWVWVISYERIRS